MGIIGFGSMARQHYQMLIGYDRVAIKGIYDPDRNACDHAKERNLEVYPSQKAILSDEEIDIILVATTNDAHKTVVIDALRAGKHVICEKPVTISSEELLEIMDVVKETGKVFTIDQNRRTNRDFVLMKRKVEEGAIGQPYVIESRVEGSRGMPSGWRTLKSLGGGMMLDWGVHLIDQLMYMIPQKVTQIYCKMLSVQYPEVDDNFHLMMTFEDGLTAIVEVGTNHYIPHPRWYVMGEKGTLQIDSWDCDGKIVRCTDTEVEWEEEIFYTMAGPTKTMAPRNDNCTETIPLSLPEGVTDDVTVVYDQFTDAIEGKAELTITPQQALRVMYVMEAAFQSAKEHKSIDVSI